MCPLLLSRKEPVLWLRAAAAFFPVKKQDVLKPHGELDLSGITALADFFRYRDGTGSKGDVPEAQRCHFAETECGTVSDGKLCLMLQVLRAEDELHGFFL